VTGDAAAVVCVRGGRVFDPGEGLDLVGDVLVRDGVIVGIGPNLPTPVGTRVIDARGSLVTPHFTDLHVHLREPGGEESETIATGTAAAIAGGFGTIYAMPNTNPTADRPEVIEYVRRAAAAAGPCEVVPVSAITEGLRGRVLVDLEAQAAAGAGAFSDDGAWVASDALASAAFEAAAAHDWLVMEHCEDFGITGPGLLHDAAPVRAAGIPGIPREAEDRATARDLDLARRFGTRLHLCHVSTAGAVAALRRAKDAGLSVSGEVTPHHLVLTVADAVRGGVDFKMKPPLRERTDVDALVRALEDGTLDAIGTDHAPHSEAKKGAGLPRAPFGAIGLETAFPVLYTHLVRTGRLGLSRLIDALVSGPARVTRRAAPAIRRGVPARLNVIDVAAERSVDRARTRSKSRNCPFHGMVLTGWPICGLFGTLIIDHAPL
jgi:dihydroorotase